jgi:tetratricopeptide (TPR) repeat protein
MDAARRLERVTGVPAAHLFAAGQLYVFVPVVTELRFGRWDAVLAEPKPPADLKLDTAVSLYARGFAFANKGDIMAAQRDRALLATLQTDADLKKLDGAGVPAPAMAEMSLDLLDGEIARKTGRVADAISDFTKARAIEIALPYTEPPYWHQPVSHILGAALLEAHRASEAEAVYRDSLMRYRMDGWALFGLAQALDAQGKTDEAAATRKELGTIWQMADVTLTASRF